jgi:hypothetical protein
LREHMARWQRHFVDLSRFHALTMSRRLCGFNLIWAITLSI